MSLSQRLAQPYQFVAPALPNFKELNKTLQRVSERYDQPRKKPLQHARQYLDEFAQKLDTADWRATPLSFVTQVASFAFDRTFRGVEQYENIRRFMIREAEVSTRSSFLSALVDVYIESFEPGAKHTSLLSRALYDARDRNAPRWRKLFDAVPDFLLHDKAVNQLAALMQQMDDPWHGLRALGLRQPHAPGLMDHVHAAFVRGARKTCEGPEGVKRMLGWLKPPGHAVRRVGAGDAINVMLSPWTGPDCPSEISTLLIDNLTAYYGHPRVGRDAVWNEVDPELERMFMRWLVHADFRFLFRILREVEPSHMFPDREAFWLTELEAGRVQELWVAFRPEGYRLAQQRLPDGGREAGRFALLKGGGPRSLLFMRVGEDIVVEGTHSFPICFFNATSRRAPRLYQPQYHLDLLQRPEDSTRDSIAHQGGWERKARMRLGR
ncbi:EH signature domain-containing protein [Camelimonas lactis]|nr:EH signature domain-containing protein [Camelimonas lactis]